MTDTQELIGKILDTPQPRDAIHVAVLPVMSEAELWPGAHIGFISSGSMLVGVVDNPIGIVDPFLPTPVKPRERFWMFLYPNTVTSLRHDWDHPSVAKNGCGVTSFSDKWLRDFADRADADYWEMMEVAATHCGTQQFPDYLIEGGKWEGFNTPPEFWEHYKNVTGKTPDTKYGLPGIFSCSC